MKINKRFKKFYEVGQNRYYLLQFDDELHIATESFLPLKKFLWFNREITQGFKLLQLTGPLSMLFSEILNAEIETTDTEFPDMNTYKKVDNKALRIQIEDSYKSVLNEQIEIMKKAFSDWVDNFLLNEGSKYDEKSKKDIIETNRQRLNRNISAIKESNILSSLSFKWTTGENLIIKKLLDNDIDFLYSQSIGSNYKIYYLYDLDIYGTITIYKIHCVKNILKNVETFIYNRDIIQEMVTYIANHDM